MLQVVTGRVHPELEHALVEEIRQLKRDSPLASVAVVVPSSTLSSYLRRLLVRHVGPLLNVHFLTFHQLSLRLCGTGPRSGESSGPPVLPATERFFEQLLRSIVRRDLSGVERFRHFGRSQSAWAALWATLRDLKDAMLEPATALRAVDEGLFGAEDAPALRALFHLYAAAREGCRALGVGTPEDVTAAALEHTAGSGFLARLDRLYYYGFYDLTQVQLALLEAVSASAPVTLFFPLQDRPAFAFARRFYERALSRLGPAVAAAVSSERPARETAAETAVFNTVGPEDELATVCKQVLVLVETHGYRFDEIGVVGRTLAPYRGRLGGLFDRHGIPYRSSIGPPLVQEPAAKAALQLASLPLTGLSRRPVMDLLSSPFCRMDRLGGAVEPRPDQWHVAVQELGIARGMEEWERLAAASHRRLVFEPASESEDQEPEPERALTIEAVQLQLLWERLTDLLDDIRSLPASGSVQRLTEAFLAAATRQLAIPGLDASEERDDAESPLLAAGRGIRSVCAALVEFDRIGDDVTWDAWVGLFARLLEDATVPDPEPDHPGVLVLDAMAARGLAFRALFVIGLNEKVFPRFIREDAFLRDRHRRVLDATLGYKIDEKLAGYDEEKLLFTLLVQAARERLYLLYQRADAAGRALVPSGYLTDDDLLPGNRGPERRIARRLADRVGMPPFLVEVLDHDEYARREILAGRDPSPLLERTGRSALFREGEAAQRRMEAESGGLGPHDGVTGPLRSHWDALLSHGVSPTSLERYARCPLQYFAAQVLRLESPPPCDASVSPLTMGRLCHEVLRTCYAALSEAGWPTRSLPAASVQQHVEAAVERACAAYANQHGTGYAVTWQLAREQVTALVHAVLEADHEECRAGGFQPVAFEVDAHGRLEVPVAAGRPAVTIRGRLDRVDRRLEPPGLRVIDYKYRRARTLRPEDRDLPVGALRGVHLQPPLYALMQPDGGPAAGLPIESVDFLFLTSSSGPSVDRARFETAAWQSPVGRQLERTFRVLLEGIRDGQFQMLPDRYCEHCDYTAACRRYHGPSWWRAHQSPASYALRRLRKATVGEGA